MKVTAILCDHAQVADGKLFIAGGGWNVTGPQPSPSAIALLFEVPWGRANEKIKFSVRLIDEDENLVTQNGPLGEVPIEINGEFEVGRPAGVKPGAELNAPLAIPFPPLLLEPEARYLWVIEVQGGQPPNILLPFATRPAV